MDMCNHYVMQSLFKQLGLPSKNEQIKDFIKHHPLVGGERIEQASFWSSSQASFIEESISEDSVWSMLVDRLDEQLHL